MKTIPDCIAKDRLTMLGFLQSKSARTQIDRERRVREELVGLDQKIGLSWPPQPATLVEVRNGRALWQITLGDGGACFMCLATNPESTSFVVHVHADRFYRAWLAAGAFSDRRPDACKLRDEMPSDYKFPAAARCMSIGAHNPVPLADGGAALTAAGVPEPSFVNGVTRTFWLLANHARAFPIEVSNEPAALALFAAAGLGQGPIPVPDLHALNRYDFEASCP